MLAAIDRDDDRWTTRDSIEELGQLAQTAGAEVVGAVIQKRETADPATYLGRGKLDEVGDLREETEYNAVIFDDELTPTQQRNLEKKLGVKVLDRTALILDIFAGRARTREGQLQVDLAQSEYLLPRLAGQWSHLERLGGGIGTRGPGESQIETDRRLARGRIAHLKREIEEVRRHRQLYRDRRRRQGIPVAALVGYTNAGKSTLLNALTDAAVLAEDKLFATLDPTTRKVDLPNQQAVLITDTVGFIQKLPTTLVAAFRATLEELQDADVLIHVLDISHPNADEQRETVEDVLEELGVVDKPTVLALNKADRLVKATNGGVEEALAAAGRELGIGGSNAVLLSAERRWGLDRLLVAVQDALARDWTEVHARIPYGEERLVRLLHERGQIHTKRHTDTGTEILGRVPPDLAAVFAAYPA